MCTLYTTRDLKMDQGQRNLYDSLKFQFSLQRVQTKERGDVGDDPGVHLTVTTEVRSCPVTGSVGGCLVAEREVLVADGAGAVGV